ncbi:MAG: sigma-70 family RNA polymerase sigma factor [Verrucomicrobiales bacterium]|nr:sigma-70 family RNA polymerase sigma factor [Verrucomicrobiales bacterium]
MLTANEFANSFRATADAIPPGRRIFATTHWTVVLSAGESDSVTSRLALETLCQAYWAPIYVYVRRRGYGPDDAEDLTQEFFAQLIAKDQVRLADRTKGRFRTFLLAFLDYFLAREWTRAHRQKRGGQFRFVSLDGPELEERYQAETVDPARTPEKAFLHQWALTVLSQAMKALEAEFRSDGRQRLFQELRTQLSGDRGAASAAELGRRLGMGEGAVRVAVHRLRRRFGELLRQEIQQTVASPEEVDEELRYLRRVLSE